MVQMVPAIKNKSWFFHLIKNFLVVQLLVCGPFGDQRNSVRSLNSLIGVFNKIHAPLNALKIFPGIVQRMRIGDIQAGFFLKKTFANINRRRIPGIPGIRFECETKNRQLLSNQRIEHGLQNSLHISFHLVIVEGNHLLPESGNFIQLIILTQVDQVQNILAKTGSAKAWSRI